MEGHDKFPYATNHLECNRQHQSSAHHLNLQHPSSAHYSIPQQQQTHPINDRINPDQRYNGYTHPPTVTNLPPNPPNSPLNPNNPPNISNLSSNPQNIPKSPFAPFNITAHKNNGVDSRSDNAVQVDWSLFADEDNRFIMKMLALNTSKMPGEGEDEHQREIREYRSREYNLLGHLNDYRKRTDELKRKLHLKEMYVERLEGELVKYKEQLVEARGKERELQYLINDLQLSIKDVMQKYREERVLSSLREAEQLSNKLCARIKNKPSKSVPKEEEIFHSPDRLKTPSVTSLKTSLSMSTIPPTITITDPSPPQHPPSKQQNTANGSFDKTDSLSSKDSIQSDKQKKQTTKKEVDRVKQSNVTAPARPPTFSEQSRREILISTLLNEF